MDDSAEWREFQAETAAAFRLAGYEIQTDILVGHKKVDVLASERRLGKVHRIAIECKNWEKPLTQRDISEIYANYLPLVGKSVDSILLVTKQGVAESAKRMINDSPNLNHQTLTELYDGIIDFRPYLQHLMNQYYADGLDRYYVGSRTTDGADLLETTIDWLNGNEQRPLAILGSYGIGKTTFATRLSSDLARSALSSPTARIPILVRLGEIADEQSLEGLFGKLLAARFNVRNYNFSAIDELNRRGRLCVIFDGFDEMKQGISWDEFKYNIHQINRLVVSHSKIIILGRPTVFLNDSEYRYTLHGTRLASSNGIEIRDPEWPDYLEREVAQFNKDQMKLFLPAYIAYLIDTIQNERQKNDFKNFMSYDVEQLATGRIGDIARRPVQLKMLVEILPDLDQGVSRLTVNDLYDYFISFVIERESYKSGRGKFTTPQRRAFARDVALWLWKSGDTSTSETAIPPDLVTPFLKLGEPADAAVRDLVSASILDRRPGGLLHFPHRSLQEFLVAEGIKHGVVQHALSLYEIPRLLNQEVIDFLRGFIDRKFMAAIGSQFQGYRGELPLAFLRLVAANSNFTDYIKTDTPWGVLLLAISSDGNDGFLKDAINDVLAKTSDERSAISTLYAALVACRPDKGRPKIERYEGLIIHVLESFRRIVLQQRRRKKRRHSDGIFGTAQLLSLLKAVEYSSAGSEDKLSLVGVYRILRDNLRGFCYVSDWDGRDNLRYVEAGLPERVSDRFRQQRAAHDLFLSELQLSRKLPS